jgi:ATP phosphoribosyltransferase regulatory subunit
MKTLTPAGVRDFLPIESAKREAVIKTIIEIFETYNYQRVHAPVIELYEVLKKGLSQDMQKRCIRFVDRSGQLMILRPDMTTPIARMVASRLRTEQEPLRLYYVDKVFRHQHPEAGYDIEFLQVGIELIGNNSTDADEEVIKIAREALTATGLQNIEIDRGNIKDYQHLSAEKKQALIDGDYVTYGDIPKRSELSVKDFEYYTGMVFECYVPDIGYVLGGGGRYDNLLAKFDHPRPAVGFALNLETILLALKRQEHNL